MPRMRLNGRTLLCILALLCACFASDKIAPELLGTWNYTSMAALDKGKPSGTIHFHPGQWSVTFGNDAKWSMILPSNVNAHGLSGTYKIHKQTLEMRLSDGRPYYKYRFSFEEDGKVLVLTGDQSINRATR